MANKILEHCNQKFAVQSMIRFRNVFVLGGNLDKQVVFCPFCGQRLTPLAPDSSKAGVLSLPESVLVENALPAVSG